MLNKIFSLIFLFTLFATRISFATLFIGKALVYKGAGACSSCSESAYKMAGLAGYEAKYIGPTEGMQNLFEGVALYIQPGGKSLDVAKAMTPELKNNLLNFIRNGGGYVGFCAGAFYATEEIRDEGVAGLGIIPGQSWLWEKVKDSPTILQIRWEDQTRDLYWEGGPYLDFSKVDMAKTPIEIIATYNDGQVAAARTTFGLGRVFVTGVHPESPESWREGLDVHDSDGLDWDLAVQMIKWSARK